MATRTNIAILPSQGILILMRLTHVLETALYVQDLERAETFYTGLLDQPPYHREPGHYVFYKLKEAMLLIFNPGACSGDNHGIPPHGSNGPGHVCFRIDESEVETWKKRLKELDIPLENEHLWPNGSTSLYFRDPAGNSLELAPWRIWNRYD
jgi:catechol 2,3-dioxygenase-like lactoylglutathione lyase family enzyme